MSRLYRPGHRSLRRQFDPVRPDDRLEEAELLDHLSPGDRAFIEARDVLPVNDPARGNRKP